MSPQVAEIQVETAFFPPNVKPPGSSKALFLAGAGVRGIEVPGKFLKVTAIGFYVEDGTVPFLAAKWKGKDAAELSESGEFIHDVIAAPFDRFLRVTFLMPLKGVQFSEKVMENCIAHLKSIGKYTEAEPAAVEKFLEAFSPGASIPFAPIARRSDPLFTRPDFLSIITWFGRSLGVHHRVVSPAARQNLATRLSKLFGGCENGKMVEGEKEESNGINGEAVKTQPVVVALMGESVEVV